MTPIMELRREPAALNGIGGPPPGYYDDGPDLEEERDQPDPWSSLVTPAPPEWWTTPPPARTWLLRDARRPETDGVLPLGKVGQMIAEGGAGKTMALTQLAVAVATGTRWLGTFEVLAGRTLILAGEEDADEAHRRCYRARRAAHAPVPPEGSVVVLPLAGVPCPLLERDERRNLMDTAFAGWLREWASSHGPWDLVIVDPLSRFAGPDAEIDNAAATRFVQVMESVAVSTGATVLVAHHTTKVGRRGGAVDATAGRGASALVDGARWQCSLGVEHIEFDDVDVGSRLGEIVTWSQSKSNYSQRPADLLLRRDLDNGGALVPLDATDMELVAAARGTDATRTEKRRAREADEEARAAREDAAVLRAVEERPGIPLRDLLRAVQAAAHCGVDRAAVAITRVADRLQVREGPRRSKLHYPTSGTHEPPGLFSGL